MLQLQLARGVDGTNDDAKFAALQFAFGQMVEATSCKLPIPGGDELVLRAAELLFCRSFREVGQVEAVLSSEPDMNPQHVCCYPRFPRRSG